MGLMHNKALWLTLMSGASAAAIVSGATTLLDGDDGLALDFTDDSFFSDTGFYGSAAIVGGGTQDGYDTSPDATAASLLTYTSPSVKMTMGPSGTLRYGAHNLLPQSEGFNDASWTKGNSTVSAGATPPAPYAASWKLEEDSAAAQHKIERSDIAVPSGALAKMSVVAKADERSFLWLYTGDGGGVGRFFNLSTGALGSVVSGTPASSEIEALGNGWYKCTIEAAGTGAGVQRVIGVGDADGSFSYTGTTGSGILIAGAHLRCTLSDSTYLATTSAARYSLPYEWSSAGVLQGLLVEEARTNLCLYSKTCTTAPWVAITATLTANAAVAPDGTTTATLLTSNTTLESNIYQAVTITTAAHTWSYFVKKGTTDYAVMSAYDGAQQYTYFNLANGTVGTNAAGNTASITSVGNGWYRLAVTRTAGSTTGFTTIGMATADNSLDVAGGDTLYVWGAQLEAGAFPTSPIETFASTVTRATDNISLSTSAFPFSATTGTLYTDAVWSDTAGIVFNLSDGTTNERFQVQMQATGLVRFRTVDGGATQHDVDMPGDVSDGAAHKTAYAYELNNVNSAVDGTAGTTDTSATIPTVTTLSIGSSAASFPFNNVVRRFMYLPRRMSNGELVTLTT